MIQAIKFIIYLKQSTYVCGAFKTRVRQKDCSNKRLNYFVRLLDDFINADVFCYFWLNRCWWKMLKTIYFGDGKLVPRFVAKNLFFKTLVSVTNYTNIKTIWPSSKIDVTNISVGHSEWLSPQKCQGGSELLLLIWYWWLQVISNVGDKIKILLTSSWCWHPILISIDQRCRWPKGP